MEKVEKKQTGLWLPVPIMERLRTEAFLTRQAMGDVAARILDAHLPRHELPERTQRPARQPA